MNESSRSSRTVESLRREGGRGAQRDGRRVFRFARRIYVLGRDVDVGRSAARRRRGRGRGRGRTPFRRSSPSFPPPGTPWARTPWRLPRYTLPRRPRVWVGTQESEFERVASTYEPERRVNCSPCVSDQIRPPRSTSSVDARAFLSFQVLSSGTESRSTRRLVAFTPARR